MSLEMFVGEKSGKNLIDENIPCTHISSLFSKIFSSIHSFSVLPFNDEK
jgi:hypothetical protein